MSKHVNLDRGDVLPASWTDALQEVLGATAPNIRLSQSAANTVQIASAAGSYQAAIGIGGLWRWRATNVTASASGVAGVKDVYVVASANVFSNTPVPDTDTTEYEFGLVVVTAGTVPSGNYTFSSGAKAIVQTRKIGEVDWNGTTTITGLRQLHGLQDATAPLTPTAPSVAVSPVGAVGVAGQTAPLFAGRVGTAPDVFTVDAAGNLAAAGATFTGVVVGPTALSGTSTTQLATTAFVSAAGNLKANLASPAFTGVLTIDGDVNLYRGGANVLKTDDAFYIVRGGPSDLALYTGTTADTGAARFVLPVSGAMAWGPGTTPQDTNLYRSGVSVLRTDNEFQSGASIYAGAGLVGQVRMGSFGPGGASAVQFGSASDTNLYRSAANQLKTDGAFQAASYAVGATALASTHLSDTAALARLAGPTFTGVPAAPTAAAGANTTQLATTAFVTAAVSASSPSGVAYLANAQTFTGANTFNAATTFTGVPSGPTAAANTNTTQLATTAFVAAAVVASSPAGVAYLGSNQTFTGSNTFNEYTYLGGLRIKGTDTGNTIYQATGPLGITTAGGAISIAANTANANPRVVVDATSVALSGLATAATAAVDTNTTQLATTAFVIGQGYAPVASPVFTGVSTFRGGWSAQAAGTGIGRVGAIPGSATNSGYLEWFNTAAARLAYMGYDNTNLTLHVENGAHFAVTQAANTGLTAEKFHTYLSTGSTQTFTTAPASQRAVVVTGPVYAGATAQTITSAATLAITGPPTAGANMTITNPYALWVQGGTARFDGNVSATGTVTSSGLIVGNGGLNLGNASGTLVGTGAGLGDKVLVYDGGGAGTQYGFGLQASSLVAFVPSTAAFVVRPTTTTGNLSSGTNAVSLGGNGNVTATGTINGATLQQSGANISSLFASLTGANTLTGTNNFTSNKGATSTLGANNTYALAAYATDGGAAAMSFHRAGQYAINMGLDPDSWFRIGGWSAAANLLQLSPAGALYTATEIYANVGLTQTIIGGVGPANQAGIRMGADTNLYRAAADVLKTDDQLQVGANLVVGANTVGGAIYFGSAVDTNLYRDGANFLKTDDTFVAGGGVYSGGTMWFGASAGAYDTNLYRSGAGVLTTDGAFQAASYAVGATALASTHLSDTAALARLAGPTFTGVPAAPTAAADTNTTQLATTAFVVGQAATASPVMDGTVAIGVSNRFSRGDHVHPTDTSRASTADSRFPAGADIVNADIGAAAAIAESKLTLASDAAAATASRRTLGTGSAQAAAGNDARLSNQRPPQGPETNLKIIRGVVNSNGTIGLGSGFTVAQVSAGDVIVYWANLFSSAPSVTLSVYDESSAAYHGAAQLQGIGTGQVRVYTFQYFATWDGYSAGAGGKTYTYLPFSFIAVGPA